MEKLINEYKKIIDEIKGIYLDSALGFELLLLYISKFQKKAIDIIKEPLSVRELDERPFIYGKGHPSGGNRIHTCTQGELKERNQKGGKNYKNIGNFMIVLIYQFWENKYREEIAESLNLTKNELISDVFGDLNYLRQSIIHNNGFANSDLAKKAKIFKWFKHKEEIFIDETRLLKIVNEVIKYLDSLIQSSKKLQN